MGNENSSGNHLSPRDKSDRRRFSTPITSVFGKRGSSSESSVSLSSHVDGMPRPFNRADEMHSFLSRQAQHTTPDPLPNGGDKIMTCAMPIPTISLESEERDLFTTPPQAPRQPHSRTASTRSASRKSRNTPKEQTDTAIARSYSPKPRKPNSARRLSEAIVSNHSDHLLKPGRVRSGSAQCPSTGSNSSLSVSPGSDSGLGRSSSLSITRLLDEEQKAINNAYTHRRRSSDKGKPGTGTISGASTSGITIIRQVWTQLMTTMGPQSIGMDIFQRVSVKNRVMQAMLRNCHFDLETYPNTDAFVKTHAKSIALSIDKVIRETETKEDLLTELNCIGGIHAGEFGTDFKVDFFSTFGEALLDCSMEWGDKSKRTEEWRKAWISVISFMTDNLKSGFQRERRNRARSGMNMTPSPVPPFH